MVSKLCLLSVAAFVGVVVLGMGCNAQEVVFRDRVRRGQLDVAGVRRVMTAIANLINGLRDGLHYGGTSVTRAFPFAENVEVTIRLYFYNRVHSISGWCSMNPVWNQVMSGQEMFDRMEDIYNAMVRSALEGFYGHMGAVAGSLGIEYYVPPPDYNLATNIKTFNPAEHQNVSFHLDDDSPCWVYSTCLISGQDAAMGSYLGGGASLVSGNENYKLIMQKDCNLVLYDISTGSYVPRWDSKSQNKGSGCYVNLQMDGNLVIVDDTGVDVMWASNSYCQLCIRTTALVVQDDGNLVIYNTDLRKPIWSII